MRFLSLLLLLLVLPTPATAQRVYISPIADFAIGDAGPTRFEYITHLRAQQACQTVRATSRRELANYEVWFEFEGRHYMIVWDADGSVIAMGDAALSNNIVKDACEAMTAHATGEETDDPPVRTYPSCPAMRDAGWDRGVNQNGGTYQDSWDDAERDTYRLNAELDRNMDGQACNL